MKVMQLIGTDRLDGELKDHRIKLEQKEMEEFRARLTAFIRNKRGNSSAM
jgi:hypothetical protein